MEKSKKRLMGGNFLTFGFLFLLPGGKKVLGKDITREEQEVSIRSQNVTNALFVGSTAELQKLLNNRET